MRMAQETEVLKGEKLDDLFAELKASIQVASQQGHAAHEVELNLWKYLLQLGHELFGRFLAMQGSGDMGETVTLPDGRCCQRLEERHRRRLASFSGKMRGWVVWTTSTPCNTPRSIRGTPRKDW